MKIKGLKLSIWISTLVNDFLFETGNTNFMRISVSNNCIGCGACSTISPEVFEIYRNSAIADQTKIYGNEDSCIDAAINCPVSAIKIEEY